MTQNILEFLFHCSGNTTPTKDPPRRCCSGPYIITRTYLLQTKKIWQFQVFEGTLNRLWKRQLCKKKVTGNRRWSSRSYGGYHPPFLSFLASPFKLLTLGVHTHTSRIDYSPMIIPSRRADFCCCFLFFCSRYFFNFSFRFLLRVLPFGHF